MLESFLNTTSTKLTPAQVKRIWELNRFDDEPCLGAPRRRLSVFKVAEAYQAKLATFDDIVDCLLGPNRGEYHGFGDLHSLTGRPLGKEIQQVLNETKGLNELLTKIREFLLNLELNRGEAATAWYRRNPLHSNVLWHESVVSCHGSVEQWQIQSRSRMAWEHWGNLAPPHYANFEVNLSDGKRDDGGFAKHAKQAIADGYCDETRLLELSFLAPQWSKFIGEFIGWNGFSEGLYWFLSHMNTWYSDAREAAGRCGRIRG